MRGRRRQRRRKEKKAVPRNWGPDSLDPRSEGRYASASHLTLNRRRLGRTIHAKSVWFRLAAIGSVALWLAAASMAGEARRVISLDGAWDIAEGKMEQAPTEFAHRVPVPGLVDMAEPAFAEVGQKSALRQAFWYRRSFRIDGPVPAVALLKIAKAAYGTRVVLNGKPLGDHLPSFTPGYFDLHAAAPRHRGA